MVGKNEVEVSGRVTDRRAVEAKLALYSYSISAVNYVAFDSVTASHPAVYADSSDGMVSVEFAFDS